MFELFAQSDEEKLSFYERSFLFFKFTQWVSQFCSNRIILNGQNKSAFILEFCDLANGGSLNIFSSLHFIVFGISSNRITVLISLK